MSEEEDHNPDEPEFIDDGHLVTVVWDKDSVRISHVECPNKGMTAACNRRRTYCVVERFVEAQGFESNIGRAVVHSPMQVAWVGVIGDSDLDPEFNCIWILPVNDADFKEWKASKGESSPDPLS